MNERDLSSLGIRVLAPLTVALTLIGTSWFAVASLHTEHVHDKIGHAALNLRAELNHLSSLENAAEASKEVDPDELDAAVAEAGAHLHDTVSGLPPDEAAELSADVLAFVSAAQATTRAFLDGNDGEADDLDDDETKPLFDSLTTRLRMLENEAEQRAQESAEATIKGLIGASAFAAVVIGIVVVVAGHSRSRHALARARDEMNERYQSLIEHSPLHLYVISEARHLDFISPAAARCASTVLDTPLTTTDELVALLSPDDQQQFGAALLNGTIAFDVPHLLRVGPNQIWFEATVSDHRSNPMIAGIVLSARDISERVNFEELLRRQAGEDELTGLPNRRELQKAIGRAFARSGRGASKTGLLLIDLDGFKGINDTLGHPVGDALLVQVANRLRSTTRINEQPARLGGDEFAVVVEFTPGKDDDPQAEATATRVLETLREPYEIDGQLLSVNASIGIAVASDVGDSDALFRHSDIALYEAKHAGGGCWMAFAPEMEDLLLVQARLKREMAAALERDEFTLVYQPLVSVHDGCPRGFEALMRWESPALGSVSPATFIPVAEQSGLIIPLGRQALRTATTQLAQWHREFDNPELSVAVNASMIELAEDDYPQFLAQILKEGGLRPDRLQIEVTESMLAEDADVVVKCLEAVRALGVRVALDDFGTGYSSMSQLQALPVDCLKIDRAFIQAMEGDDRATSVVHALIELGKALGLTVVAEGVEEMEQLEAIRDPQCDLAQGFLLARPLVPDDVPAFIAKGAQGSLPGQNQPATAQ